MNWLKKWLEKAKKAKEFIDKIWAESKGTTPTVPDNDDPPPPQD